MPAQVTLETYFKRGLRSLQDLKGFVKKREYFANNTIPSMLAGKKKPASSYKTKIDNVALDLIVKSLDRVTEKHVPLIKLLNQEEAAWTNLKVTIVEGDKVAIGALLKQVQNIIKSVKALLEKTPVA